MYTDDEVFHRYYSNFDSDKASHYAGQDRLVYVAAGYHITCMYVNVHMYVCRYIRMCTHLNFPQCIVTLLLPWS